jgi:hypothetical protein
MYAYLLYSTKREQLSQYSVWLQTGRGSIPGKGKASVSRAALRPTQHPIQLVSGVLTRG